MCVPSRDTRLRAPGGRCSPLALPREFPTGLSCVPFIWQYLRDEIAMELLGGFVGISQDRTTLGLRPAIGRAVREAH